MTFEEATEVYTVEVVAESDYYRQQLISCRFSTWLLPWQGKEAGSSRNSPTCACHSILPKWPRNGFSCAIIEKTQYLMKKPRAEVWEEKKWGVGMFGHEKVKSAIQRHPAMLRQNQTNTCLPCHNAPSTIHRHAGGWRQCTHLHLANTVSLHQSQHHLHPKHHLRPPVTIRALKGPKSTICHSDMLIYTLLFPSLNYSHLMHMHRIASRIQNIIQICWLMKEQPLVSTLSAVW